ncbi:hypothetical protein [Pandoraea communis]|uniref:hypothetical protein n=1 Tax=Pandoraea communis TaxID=2508297 RepID=UPI0025A64731|nr:hypothetical protein [Pandoraea communis]MDM8356570.1 hypothetical protein [Pandoraea communis]
MTTLGLEEAAHTVICVPLNARYPQRDEDAGMFEGVCTMYYICPPNVEVDRLNIPDDLNAGEIGGIAHRDASCVVVSVDHF